MELPIFYAEGALGSPFDSKDALKERNYRWNPERKIWAKEISQATIEEEATWLGETVYSGKPFKLEFEKMTAMNRYSNRPGQVEVVKYN